MRNRDHHHFYHWKIHISRFTPEKNHIKKRFQSSSFQTPKSRSSSIQTRSISSTHTNSRFSLGNATKNILRNPNAPSHIPSENGGRGSSSLFAEIRKSDPQGFPRSVVEILDAPPCSRSFREPFQVSAVRFRPSSALLLVRRDAPLRLLLVRCDVLGSSSAVSYVLRGKGPILAAKTRSAVAGYLGNLAGSEIPPLRSSWSVFLCLPCDVRVSCVLRPFRQSLVRFPQRKVHLFLIYHNLQVATTNLVLLSIIQ